MEERRARIAARIQSFFDIFEHLLNHVRGVIAESEQREAIRRADYIAELRRRGVIRKDETLAEYQARTAPTARERQDAHDELVGRAVQEWGRNNRNNDY